MMPYKGDTVFCPVCVKLHSKARANNTCEHHKHVEVDPLDAPSYTLVVAQLDLWREWAKENCLGAYSDDCEAMEEIWRRLQRLKELTALTPQPDGDDELRTLERMVSLLGNLDPSERPRALAYLGSRFA